ncbi:ElyC/SanA/YdcF family protein [Demequina rhizosphaerae]|uniref:ElyC/SanA/YdcF family protein n=1 Tax=Demequina rhizosphaerae TaxID=1638985 RepID=UPI00078053F2|nr:ElyC/SanA/YdcF family protein [Demequina rhizosphaerae]
MRIVLVMLAAMGVFGVVGTPLYVLPASDEPRAADAVYVIGPPTDARIELAESMIVDDLAGTMVVSLSEDPDERAEMPLATRACEEARDYPVLCSQPAPFTTRGEARWLRDLVDDEGWESVAVVTVTPHLTRTRVIFERCWDGDLAYVDSGERLSPVLWAYQYLYQSAAFIKVAGEDGC